MNYFANRVKPTHEGDTAGPGMLTRLGGFFTSAVMSIVNFCEAVVFGSWDLASQVVSSTIVKSISNVAAMVTFELFIYVILAVSCILIALVLNSDQIFKNSRKSKDKTEEPPQQPQPEVPENTEVPPSELAPTIAPAPQPPADPVCEYKPGGL